MKPSELVFHEARLARKQKAMLDTIDYASINYPAQSNTCPDCKGTGERFTKRHRLIYVCMNCDGTGVVKKQTHRMKL